jgi:hypothetical protein
MTISCSGQEIGLARNKFFWAEAEDAGKDFVDQLRPMPYASFGGPVVSPARPILIENATKVFQREKAFVVSGARTELAEADIVHKSMDQQLNGLLITACNAEEKAAASTPATSGLSAFTYCLTSAWRAMRTMMPVDQIVTSTLHVDAGNRLRALNLTQTPWVVEPPTPPGLAARSFVTLETP